MDDTFEIGGRVEPGKDLDRSIDRMARLNQALGALEFLVKEVSRSHRRIRERIKEIESVVKEMD